MDDQARVREDLQECLGTEYRVRVADKPELARRMADIEPFDFAIVDLELGDRHGLGGIEMAQLLARIRPKIKIVLLALSAKDHEIEARLTSALPIAHGYVWKADPAPGVNYIEETLHELRRLEGTRAKEKCFVIMPFSTTASCHQDTWTDIFENDIRPAAEETGRYECSRSAPKIGNIITQIFDSLNGAEVVIADLTDQNANVFYELGVRHSRADATVLIAQDLKFVPFDLRSQVTYIYDWKTQAGRAKLRGDIKAALSDIADDIRVGRRDRIISPVLAYLNPLQKV